MQQRFRRFLSLQCIELCYSCRVLSAWRHSCTKGTGSDLDCGPTENEDPVTVLRALQQNMRKRAGTESRDIPPPPPRHSGKTQFFEESPSSTCGKENPRNKKASLGFADGISTGAEVGTSGSASMGKHRSPEKTTSNPFLQKLSKMETDARLPSFPTYNAAAEERRKRTNAKIKEERSKMLVFRDVGMDLDKPILSRDVFLVFKYFRYGMEFAVDNELERMLRYFNEHATNELKIIQGSKLMRGPPTLSRRRRNVQRLKPSSILGKPALSALSYEGANVENGGQRIATMQEQNLQFQIESAFPRVRCANMHQFCSTGIFKPAATSLIGTLLSTSHSASSFASFVPSAPGKASTHRGGRSYNVKDESLFTLLAPSSFRRPAVVIYSQLGQRYGSQADDEWRRLAYLSTCPGLLPYLPPPAQEVKVAKSGAVAVECPFGTPRCSLKRSDQNKLRAVERAMPIDVISLRSTDVYKYDWVQRLYVNRFAKSLSQAKTSDDEQPSQEEVMHALLASTTFVGCKLLEPFYSVLGLRNYLLPHVMLVDHEGVVRWMSGGLPDADEKAVFPSLLRQLEAEYFKGTK